MFRIQFFFLIVALLSCTFFAAVAQMDDDQDGGMEDGGDYTEMPVVPSDDLDIPYTAPPRRGGQMHYPNEYEDNPDDSAYPDEAPPNQQRGGTLTPRSSRPITPGVRPTRPPAPSVRDRASMRPPAAPMPSMRQDGESGEGHPMASEEKTGEKPDDPINFDFQDAPLYTVVESISRPTGRNFDLDPSLSAVNVTIITHDKIPPEMAYEVLESILSSRGFSMVESLDGHLIKILPTPDAVGSDKTPLIMGPDDLRHGFDGLSTHIVTIENGDAAEIQRALQILGSKNGQIDVYAPTNTLILTDSTDGLKRMFTFLAQADVPGFDSSMEIFTLEYTRAEVLSTQIQQVLLGDATGAPTGARPPQQPQVPQAPVRPVRGSRPPVMPQSSSQVIGFREEVLRMVPDERLNALIVVATQNMMAQVRDLVKRLDTPTPYEANNMHIYQLLNADAEAVEAAIQPLIGTAPRKQGAAGGQAGGGGGATAPEVQPFEQKVQITRYDKANSLLIVASPQDYKLLESFIARLDVPQRQVCVEAVVMEVKMTDDFGLTVDTAAMGGHDGFAMSSTDNLATLLDAAKVAEEIVGGPKASIRNAALGLGKEGRSGLTLGVYDDLSFTYKGRKIKVPFAPVLFQAVEKLSDTEVLSQPSLVTLDNEEANIIVGQEVPFITSTSSSRRADSSMDTGTYGGYTRVERQDVGIKLKVTPQISEGDNVMLSSEVEISDTNATSITNVDITGPTTNKSKVTNKTLVKDGSTAVIAGLIRDSAVRKRAPQTPILGDLPILNWFFSSRQTGREKQNMVMLITPHIVKEGMDIDRLTNYKINEYYDANVEDLFKGGFFDRVFQKYNMRQNHRPTLDRSEALSGRRSGQKYKRGDIER
ncbi:MAG: type II secretion system secretin GspD [Candidatus Hydrogenedentes bacterium]|nr:type II secretion system secretin GspD [Candidatus Hydrogenedentota bacterium]